MNTALNVIDFHSFIRNFLAQNNVTTTRGKQVYLCACCANDLLVGRHEMR